MINFNCKLYDLTISGTWWGFRYADRRIKKNLLYFQTCLRCHDRQILLITVKLIKQHKKTITLIHVHAIYACYFVFCRKCRIKTIRIMCSYWCPVSIYDIVKFILACDNIAQKESGRYRITQSKKLNCKHFRLYRLIAN